MSRGVVGCVFNLFYWHMAQPLMYFHTNCETWPSEFRGNRLVGFKVTRVLGSLMIVTARQDSLTKGVLRGNINTTFVHEDVVVILPVREMGSECGRNILQ